jgi:hypothetical protein
LFAVLLACGVAVHEIPGPRRRHLDLPGLLTRGRRVSGAYFANGKPKPANPFANDPVARSRLWQVSAVLTGIAYNGIPPDPNMDEPRWDSACIW